VTSPKKVPVRVLEVLEDALRLVRMARRNREMLWGYDCPPSIVALGDRQQLTQVLVNLLTNACDASASGQPVRVEARAQSPAWLEVDVIDEGGGIPKAIESRIFEPFFTTKGLGSGTGLGLAVTEGIVRAHGGRLEVLSREGEGTTMRVVLRRAVERRG
jgi:signal transduction histidine kinase